MTEVSIIIPTYNEARYLSQTLVPLTSLNPLAYEIIVVDGSSSDRTRQVAQNFPVTVLTSNIARRSLQMNLGAQMAQGYYLCFLHADTLVPEDLITQIRKTLANEKVALGGFISLMKGQQIRWLPTSLNYLKTYWAPLIYQPYRFLFKGLRLLFGDQVMFCRRTDFLSCGGFDPNLPIMEEADICLRMNRLGSIKQIRRTVISSDRRLSQWGHFKAHIIWIGVCILWSLRVSPHWLKRFYEEVR
ncbi:MAG: TIGR04283 family arsenosugar biosynthesis glycosyltransferase [Bacteroidota bacterium]